MFGLKERPYRGACRNLVFGTQIWGGGEGGHTFTVKNHTKQWINDMYNLFMIYITLFIIL